MSTRKWIALTAFDLRYATNEGPAAYDVIITHRATGISAIVKSSRDAGAVRMTDEARARGRAEIAHAATAAEGQYLAYLVLAQHCLDMDSGDRGGPTDDMLDVAKALVGLVGTNLEAVLP